MTLWPFASSRGAPASIFHLSILLFFFSSFFFSSSRFSYPAITKACPLLAPIPPPPADEPGHSRQKPPPLPGCGVAQPPANQRRRHTGPCYESEPTFPPLWDHAHDIAIPYLLWARPESKTPISHVDTTASLDRAPRSRPALPSTQAKNNSSLPPQLAHVGSSRPVASVLVHSADCQSTSASITASPYPPDQRWNGPSPCRPGTSARVRLPAPPHRFPHLAHRRAPVAPELTVHNSFGRAQGDAPWAPKCLFPLHLNLDRHQRKGQGWPSQRRGHHAHARECHRYSSPLICILLAHPVLVAPLRRRCPPWGQGGRQFAPAFQR